MEGHNAGWSSPVARQAHNLKVVGSNPTPATSPKKTPAKKAGFFMDIVQKKRAPSARSFLRASQTQTYHDKLTGQITPEGRSALGDCKQSPAASKGANPTPETSPKKNTRQKGWFFYGHSAEKTRTLSAGFSARFTNPKPITTNSPNKVRLKVVPLSVIASNH